MQSCIIKTNQSIEGIISIIKNYYKIDIIPTNIKIIDSSTSKLKSKSIGIGIIKDLVEWSALKTSDPKVCIILDAQNLTSEAQNAMLKIVEEPTENNLFVFVIKKSVSSILPTIRSRCIFISIDATVVTENLDNIDIISVKTVESLIQQIANKDYDRQVVKQKLEDLLGFYLNKIGDAKSNKDDNYMIELLKEGISNINKKGNVRQIFETIIFNLFVISKSKL